MPRCWIPHLKTLSRNQFHFVSRKDIPEMITKKNIAKFVIAVALTIATIAGSGVVADQVGLDVGQSVYACGSAGGGGC